jgi:hypothetical protein
MTLRENESRASPVARQTPKVRISMPSTVPRCDRQRRRPSFGAIAGIAGVLAAGLIRDNLQAHLAPARVGEQPTSSTTTRSRFGRISTAPETASARRPLRRDCDSDHSESFAGLMIRS